MSEQCALAHVSVKSPCYVSRVKASNLKYYALQWILSAVKTQTLISKHKPGDFVVNHQVLLRTKKIRC